MHNMSNLETDELQQHKTTPGAISGKSGQSVAMQPHKQQVKINRVF